MAHYIYFLIKNYPEYKFIEDYPHYIKRTRIFLKDAFSWKISEICRFVEYLNILTKYIEK